MKWRGRGLLAIGAASVVLVATSCNVRVTTGTGMSLHPVVSADGQYVAFDSSADDLVPGDTNGTTDVFVWERATGTVRRVGAGNGYSTRPAISADGRYVAYISWASDLVPGDDNGRVDIFRWDATTGQTVRVTDYGGEDRLYELAISGDGRYVAYWAHDPDLAAGATVFVADVQSGVTTPAPADAHEDAWPAISDDGRWVTYTSNVDPPGPAPARDEVFVWDRMANTATSVAVGHHSDLSADGRTVAYEAWVEDSSTGTPNVFVLDRHAGTTTRVTHGEWGGDNPSISADGRWVSFESASTDLVPGRTTSRGIFLWDGSSGTISHLTPGDDAATSHDPDVSGDGRFTAYASPADTIVGGDTPGTHDVFVWDRLHGAPG